VTLLSYHTRMCSLYVRIFVKMRVFYNLEFLVTPLG
jgi:hypothetical protein